MFLSPTELERLTIFTAAELARKRRARGLRLNYPEAAALICDEILERARDGRSVADLISYGSTILNADDVMAGVSDIMPVLQVEGMFPDGTKLVTVHDPIRPGNAPEDSGPKPGEVIAEDGEIVLNAGRESHTLNVVNSGDRPVQIGSHYHFFEVNKALDFDRRASFGKRLDVPAGTAIRFEPGQSREVTLVAFGGRGEIGGLNGLTNGDSRDRGRVDDALKLARERGFKGA